MSTASQTLEPDLSGQVLERYRLIRRLGIGGMGAVYEAEHTLLEKRVAVKLLRAEFTLQEIARKRFLREAKAATRVKHPNVVDISDFGETQDGRVFFVMELLAGKDLSDLVKAEKRLPWPRVQKILLQVISALDAAHAQGIVHRDMKPSNCFLVDVPGMEDTDFIKVLDFGIAKLSGKVGEETEGLTSTDEVFGTVAYMAPEMAMGTTNDPRSDIYAVGVMMYRMLVGELPFTEGNAFQILSQHINMPPPRPRSKEPSIPEAIEEIILRALEKRADHRFQTMKELAEAVKHGRLVATGSAIEATLLAPTAAAGGTTVMPPMMAAGSSDGQTMISPTGRTPLAPVTMATEYASGPIAMHPSASSSAAMGVGGSTGSFQATGPMATGALALGTGAVPVQQIPQKSSGVMIALLAVVAVGVVIGAVMLGVLLGGKDKEDAPAVVASTPAPSGPDVEPARTAKAKPEPPAVDPPELAPTAVADAKPAGETKVPTPVDPPAAGAKAEGVSPADAEPEDVAAPADAKADTPKKKPSTAKPPKTDEAVIDALKRKIIAECSDGGETSVRLEGLIRTDGRVQGALATPKAGPGACAERILKSQRFAARDAMKPLPMFSVKL